MNIYLISKPALRSLTSTVFYGALPDSSPNDVLGVVALHMGYWEERHKNEWALQKEHYHINSTSETRVGLNNFISNQVFIEGNQVSHKSFNLINWSYFCSLLFYGNIHCDQFNGSETFSACFPVTWYMPLQGVVRARLVSLVYENHKTQEKNSDCYKHISKPKFYSVIIFI